MLLFLVATATALLANQDQCTSQTDLQLMGTIGKQLRKCWSEGTDKDSFMSCFETSGFSEGCAGCVADYAGCAKNTCHHACGRSGGACMDCMEKKCVPPFKLCSMTFGSLVTPNDHVAMKALMAPKNMCMSPTDKLILPNVGDQMAACATGGKDPATLNTCIRNYGYTATCSKCISGSMVEVLTKCPMCGTDPNSAACDDCAILANGIQTLYDCSGYVPEDELALGHDMCSESSDKNLLPSVENQMMSCAKGTKDSARLNTCFHKFGYTNSCTECITASMVDILTNCPKCGTDPMGTACVNCVGATAAHGIQTLYDCSGYDPVFRSVFVELMEDRPSKVITRLMGAHY